MDNYVRFKFLFAEGTLAMGGEAGCCAEPFFAVPVLPAMITIGDYANIYSTYPLSDFGRERISMKAMLNRNQVEQLEG